MTAEPALAAEHLSRRFRGVTAVADVSLRVPAGARFGIIGPNGAGKTTLFNLLSGELRPSAGRVTLFGRDVTRLRPYHRAALGLGRTFQVTRVFSDLTVLENLTLALHGLQPVQAVAAPAVAQLPRADRRGRRVRRPVRAGRPADRGRPPNCPTARCASWRCCWPWRSSRGCCCSTSRPPGCRPAERVDIQALLTALPPELTLVMIEHDIDLLRTVVDSAAVLHLGALVVQGPIREIQDDERVRELYLGRAAAAGCRTPPRAPPGPAGPGRQAAMIEVRDLHTYRGINYVLQGVSLTHRGRRLHRAARPQRHGQDHPGAHDHGPDPAPVRPDHARAT